MPGLSKISLQPLRPKWPSVLKRRPRGLTVAKDEQRRRKRVQIEGMNDDGKLSMDLRMSVRRTPDNLRRERSSAQRFHNPENVGEECWVKPLANMDRDPAHRQADAVVFGLGPSGLRPLVGSLSAATTATHCGTSVRSFPGMGTSFGSRDFARRGLGNKLRWSSKRRFHRLSDDRLRLCSHAKTPRASRLTAAQ